MLFGLLKQDVRSCFHTTKCSLTSFTTPSGTSSSLRITAKSKLLNLSMKESIISRVLWPEIPYRYPSVIRATGTIGLRGSLVLPASPLPTYTRLGKWFLAARIFLLVDTSTHHQKHVAFGGQAPLQSDPLLFLNVLHHPVEQVLDLQPQRPLQLIPISSAGTTLCLQDFAAEPHKMLDEVNNDVSNGSGPSRRRPL